VALITTRSQDVAAALSAAIVLVPELQPEASLTLLDRVLNDGRVAAEPAAAQAICATLHHLPLAVEIAAQRLKVRARQTLRGVASHLRDITARLDLALGDRAVRTSFLASWALLDANLRHVFTCCGVFAGRAFTVEALAYIAELEPAVTEDALFSLEAFSLLKPEAPARYRQHPLLADFAHEQLSDAPAAYLRLANYYLAFARQRQIDYAALEPEWENIMVGMRAANTQQQWQLVIEYAHVFTAPWFACAQYELARRGYAWAVPAALNNEDKEATMTLLLKWGQACLEQNDYTEAEHLLEQVIALTQKKQQPVIRADAFYALARLARQQSLYKQAEQRLADCRAIREALQDKVGIAAIIYEEVFLSYQQGDFSQQARLRAALAIQEENGDQSGALQTLRLLTLLALKQNDLDAAESYGKHALDWSVAVQNQAEWASALYDLAGVYRFQGRFAEALTTVEESILQFQRMGDRRSLALAYYELSSIQIHRKQYDAALLAAQNSLGLLRTLNDEYILVFTLLRLGDVYQHLGDTPTARVCWTEGHNIAKPQIHPLYDELEARLG
jgi:tetratricopeptide (TPR) repeat protein